jgi:hypothetical protein
MGGACSKDGKREMNARSWSKNLGRLGRRTHRCEYNVKIDINAFVERNF